MTPAFQKAHRLGERSILSHILSQDPDVHSSLTSQDSSPEFIRPQYYNSALETMCGIPGGHLVTFSQDVMMMSYDPSSK